MMARIRISQFLISMFVAGLVTGCATNPPPLPLNNAADPQLRASSRTLRDVLAKDETTIAIEKQLSATAADAESAEKMQHDMQSMPGMEHMKKKEEHEEH
jgi:hypothetical protein